jgi:lysophospholipase L1-like esterase
MRSLKSLCAVLVAVMLTLLPSVVSSAEAAPSRGKLNVVLLGDSYSSGNGAGSYETGPGTDTEATRYRSKVNWARNYVSWLNQQGIRATFTNLARSGDTTKLLIEHQLKDVHENTDLVMLSIGGNDVGFVDIVEQCFVVALRNVSGCRKHVDKANTDFKNALNGTEEIFRLLSEKLSDDAVVVLVGYPLLSTTRDYKLTGCSEVVGDVCIDHEEYAAGTAVRELGLMATREQKKLVDRWNEENTLRVRYIDSIASAFSGHEPDPSATGRNEYRWVNEFLETEGELGSNGKTVSKRSTDKRNWYHMNIIGHQKITEEIVKSVRVPESVRAITSINGDVDIVFVLDTTASMEFFISGVKEYINDIIIKVQSKTSSSRFALVTYKDHPTAGGSPSDYPSRVDLDFVSDATLFVSVLNELTTSGGGDNAEAVYSGVMEALNLDWRPGVKKVIVTLGDAPPKDPEPVTGYTAHSVAKKAFDVDPVEVSAVDGGSLGSESMQSLINMSLGSLFTVVDDEDIPLLITDAITATLDKPFAWLQGPIGGYVGQKILLDARGSYAVDGDIVSFEWDLDGDGVYDLTTTQGLIEHVFDSPIERVLGVRVTSPGGKFAVGSAPAYVTVEPEPEPEPVIPSDMDGVYEVLDGGPLPFNVLTSPSQVNPPGASVPTGGYTQPPNPAGFLGLITGLCLIGGQLTKNIHVRYSSRSQKR